MDEIRKQIAGLILVWTLVVGISLAWNLIKLKEDALESARNHARVGFQKDVIYRKWNSLHGGVYVPLTQETPENPYLNVPEKTFTTPSGIVLTKINPAYMTRQVHELEQQETGIQGHLTSLKPIRPPNEADPWETKALSAFEHGRQEVSSIVMFRDSEHMRLMRPLLVTKDCLKCHAAQGYKEGDIRGGISISIPMNPIWSALNSAMAMDAISHFFLWLLGCAGILFSGRRIRQLIQERDKAEDAKNKMRAKLFQSAKLSTLGEMSTGLAHEINQPLGGIALVAASFRKFMEKQILTNDKLDAGLKDIDTCINRMTQTINHIRAFSRQEKLEFKPVDVAATIDTSLVLLGEQLRQHKIEVVRSFDSGLPSILGEAHQLEQVWINLISNARDAMDEKSQNVNHDRSGTAGYTKRLAVNVTHDTGRNKLIVIFSDNGSGVSEDVKQKAFEPFFTTKSVGKGTGLGLSISLGIIESHQGSIEIDGCKGEGATVKVYLPITQSP